MKKLSKKLRIFVLLMAVMLLVSGCTFLDSFKYKKAVEQFEQGIYYQAQTLFAEIEDYEDSAKHLAYISAAKLAEAGNHKDASIGFAALDDFRDSLVLSVYHAARLAEQEERYEDAQTLYQQITYGDSVVRLASLPQLIRSREERHRDENYSLAQELLNSGEYQQAIELFTQLNGYEDSTKYLMYARAIKLAEEDGEYELAINSFVSLTDFRDSSLQVAYYRARQAEAELRHEDAEELYRVIPTFRDCIGRMLKQPDLVLDRDFAALRAIAMDEQDCPDVYELSYEKYDDFWDVDDILDLFNSKYTDSDTRMYENFYLLGEEALDMNVPDGAELIFGWLADVAYRDADERVKDSIFAQCQQKMTAGEYSRATYDLHVLVEEGYAAAAEPLSECYYQMALEYEAQLDYSKAHSYYVSAGEHKDSADKAARFENEYAAAQTMADEGNYAEAARAFADLYNYRNAAELVPQMHYQHAEALIENGEWEAAAEAFVKAGDYSDAASRINEPYYLQGEKLLEEGKYNEAVTAFTSAGKYKDAAERVLMVHYALAEQALAEGKYEMASAKFKAAQNYSDAAKRIKEPYYVKAEKLLEGGKAAEAIEAFTRAGEYSNAAERILMIHYALAEQALAEGNKNEAIKAFTDAGKYKDAAERVKELYPIESLYHIANADIGSKVQFGTQNWYIINKNKEKVLLLCANKIETKFDKSKNNIWENSSVRKELNETFINETFTSVEQHYIVPTALSNETNAAGEGGNVTNDKIYIFNEAEAKQYSSYLLMLRTSKRQILYLRSPAKESWSKTVYKKGSKLVFDSTYVLQSHYVVPVMWVNTNPIP